MTARKPKSHHLRDVRRIPAWCVITRAIWERGRNQRNALKELDRRGLWLSVEQRQQAGLAT